MPSNSSNLATIKRLALIASLFMPIAAHAEDPIDRSIIFVAAHAGLIHFDSKRHFEDRDFGGLSLGLHLNRSWSTSLFYSRSHPESGLGRNVRFENYFVQVKHYWRGESQWRPYLVGGLGETIQDREEDRSSTTAHAGLGMHYAINAKWAGQLDYRYFSALHDGFQDKTLMTSLIYRFGTGER